MVGICWKNIILLIMVLFSVSVLALPVPWESKKPRQIVTVDRLYESCSVIGQTAGGYIPWFDCESYVYGVLDSYLAIRDSIPKEKRACFPEKIAPWEVLGLGYGYFLEYSEGKSTVYDWKANAATWLIERLKEKYPCK